MKFLIILSFLFLVSCGATLQEKADEMHGIAMECNKRETVPVVEDGVVKVENGKIITTRPKDFCKKEWDDWNEGEEAVIRMQERRSLRDGPKCGGRMVAICNQWCMMDKPENRKYKCVPQGHWRIL